MTTTIEECFTLITQAQEAQAEAKIRESDAIEALAECAGDRTFAYEGQVYQVRSRMNKDMGRKLSYISQLKMSEQELSSRNAHKSASKVALAAEVRRLQERVRELEGTPTTVSEDSVTLV